MTQLGEAIRLRREHLAMSQQALAEALGVGQQAISRWEKGEGVPRHPRSSHWRARWTWTRTTCTGLVPLFLFDTEDFQRRLLRHPWGMVVGLRSTDTLMPSSRSASGRQGLDHVAFAVTDMDVLRAWEEPLTDAGVDLTLL